MTEDRLLYTSEAAKALRISPRSLTRWVAQGKIRPTLKTPGGQSRFDLEELRAQLTPEFFDEQRDRQAGRKPATEKDDDQVDEG
jgi:excisionase family DNA binding protein